MKFLCKIGIHCWVWERIVEIIDYHGLKDFKRSRYTTLVRHCQRCKKAKFSPIYLSKFDH